MKQPSSASQRGWQAEIDLAFRSHGARTVLTRNRHRGPLQVQKALYPEGGDTCHVVILHPPGGIAAGDRLAAYASLGSRSQALLTTPGASKWYRSERDWAHQHLHFAIDDQAVLEWLPRENIFFDGSRVSMCLDVDLSAHAKYFGWDVLSFGRRASGESWRCGRLRMRTSIRRAERMLWSENANVDADSGFTQGVAGLAGFTVCGTLVAAGCDIAGALLDACREVRADARSMVGITQVPDVLIARYLGDSTEDAFQWFANLWAVLRQATLGKVACPPRVWAC